MEDEYDGPRRRPKLNPSMSYFQNVQNSLLLQTRRLTTYLTSDDKNATKALQQASYTAMSTLFLIICLGVALCIYFILEPFLRPLLWALLCGTLLHPLKHSLTERFKLRIDSLDSRGIPLMVGITIAPVVYLNEFSDFIETQFLIYWKAVTSLSVCCVLLYSTMPYHHVIGEWLVYTAGFVDYVIDCVDPWLSHVTFLHVFTAVTASLLLNYLWPSKSWLIHIMSSIAWGLAVILTASLVFGSLRIYILVLVVCVIVTLYASEVYEAKKKSKNGMSSSSRNMSEDSAVKSDEYESTEPRSDEDTAGVYSENDGGLTSPVDSSTPTKQQQSSEQDYSPGSSTDYIPGYNAEYKHTDSVECKEPGKFLLTTTTTTHRSAKLDDSHAIESSADITQRQKSDDSHDEIDYSLRIKKKSPGAKKIPFRMFGFSRNQLKPRVFFILILVCVVTLFYHNLWIAVCLLLPTTCAVFVRKIVQLSFVFVRLEWAWRYWRSSSLRSAVFPPVLRLVYCSYTRLDKKVLSALRKYSDSLVSGVIVIGLVLGSIALSVLLLLQLRADISHYSSVSLEMWQKVRESYPKLDELVTSSEGNGTIEQAIDEMTMKGYQYGREWLKLQVKNFIDVRTNDTHVDELMQLLDNLYNSYIIQNVSNSTSAELPSLVTTNYTHLMGNARGLLMKNYQSSIKVLRSIWELMSTHLHFAVSVVTAIISALFGGGTALLNFIVSAVVFITTLYYLLTASGAQYLPVMWISNLLPTSDDSNIGGSAFTMAIRSVFAASLQIALFYGLYTWLIHTIFGMQTAILSAALAAVAGAIPFIGTYWASLPAVLELWLVQDNPVLAVVVLCLHILPTMFVDYIIYEDSESGHPYLTGLAIIGGLYFAGLEGAILGPIMLCCLLFFQHIYESIVNSNY